MSLGAVACASAGLKEAQCSTPHRTHVLRWLPTTLRVLTSTSHPSRVRNAYPTHVYVMPIPHHTRVRNAYPVPCAKGERVIRPSMHSIRPSMH